MKAGLNAGTTTFEAKEVDMHVLPPPEPVRHRAAKILWTEMRCVRCGRLLQKIEQHALRPGKRLEIKCGHCKALNDLVGTDGTPP
jgi:phage FluMu protein Com